MKYYKIPAKKFMEDYLAYGEHQYIIQELKKEFTIWEDPCGDFESGEAPISTEFGAFNSLKEVKDILLKNDLIEESSEFIDLEEAI